MPHQSKRKVAGVAGKDNARIIKELRAQLELSEKANNDLRVRIVYIVYQGGYSYTIYYIQYNILLNKILYTPLLNTIYYILL
jgi:predicted phosphoadenosine phosphosulfate sulfurtransferase